MLVNVILDFILFIVKILWQLVKSLVPQFTIPIQFGYVLTVILSTTQQANNFIYFLVGDTAFVLIPTLILLITFKYIAYPVISLLLGIFVNKTS